MEMQATSGQFNAELFAMANGQNFSEEEFYIPFTKAYTVDSTKAITIKEAGLVNDADHAITVEGMTEDKEASGSLQAGFYKVGEIASDACTITFGDLANDEGINTVDVTFYVKQSVKKIDVDNKSTAVGELIAKWPVYASGEEGNAAGVKGHLIMQVYKCRITQMPGFDTSYKSAATNSVTFSTVEDRAHEHAYSIAYYELPKAA